VRDIIWTIILVWLVWKVIDAFKGVSKARTQNSNQQNTYTQRKEGEVKIDFSGNQTKSHFKPTDGEFVDYEEVK